MPTMPLEVANSMKDFSSSAYSGFSTKHTFDDRAVGVVGDSGLENLRRVDSLIEEGCLVEVHLFKHLDTAELLVVTEGLESRENREDRGGVEHRPLVDMGLVVEHRRDGTAGDPALPRRGR